MTKAQLRAALEAVGGRLVDDDNDDALYCDAPPGYIWAALDTRTVVMQIRNAGGQRFMTAAIKGELPTLRAGLNKVTSPVDLARHRWDEDDENWGAPADAPAHIDVAV